MLKEDLKIKVEKTKLGGLEVPNSLVERAVSLIIKENLDPLEAFKKAVAIEKGMLEEMALGTTERGQKACSLLMEKVWVKARK